MNRLDRPLIFLGIFSLCVGLAIPIFCIITNSPFTDFWKLVWCISIVMNMICYIGFKLNE